jgi:hypothetical protein
MLDDLNHFNCINNTPQNHKYKQKNNVSTRRYNITFMQHLQYFNIKNIIFVKSA